MKKLTFIFIALFVCCFAFLKLYPVAEVSGFIRCEQIFHFIIHSNGDVDYYIGYYNIMDKGVENADISKLNGHAKSKLNLKQKIEVNKYVKRIKGDDQKELQSKVLSGNTTLCVKIGDTRYYSNRYNFSAEYNINEHIFRYSDWELQAATEQTNPDVFDLCITMWFNKPEYMSESWVYDTKIIPPKEFDKQNYKKYLEEWRSIWENACRGII